MARRYFKRRRRSGSSLIDVFFTMLLFGGIAYATVWLDQKASQDFAGKIFVVDGDSLVINEQKLRLVGIDAPELGQTCTKRGLEWPCGRQSRQALRQLVKQGGVICTSEGLDKYDRWLVECRNKAGSMNAEMVKRGWAVAYGRYSSLEKTSRSDRVGIWSGEFDQPQDWREAHRGSLASLMWLNSEKIISKLRSIKKLYF